MVDSQASGPVLSVKGADLDQGLVTKLVRTRVGIGMSIFAIAVMSIITLFGTAVSIEEMALHNEYQLAMGWVLPETIDSSRVLGVTAGTSVSMDQMYTRTDLVNHLYRCFLRREPNASPDNNFVGRDFWVSTIKDESTNSTRATNGSIKALFDAFIVSQEYKGLNLTNQQIIADINSCANFGVSNSANDSFWLTEMNAGRASASNVLDQYMLSPRFRDMVLPKLIELGKTSIIIPLPPQGITLPVTGSAFITSLYTSWLNKQPDQAGLAFWVTAFNDSKRTQPVLDIYRDFFNSAEFQARGLSNTDYINLLYRSVLYREPNASPDNNFVGRDFWVSQLNGGKTRMEVLNSFLVSTEFVSGSGGRESILSRLMSLRIVVAPPQIEITTASLPPAVTGQTYSYQIHASGGNNIQWSILNNPLPTTASIDSTGLFKLISPTNGVKHFTFQATDSSGAIVSKTLGFNVSPALTALGLPTTDAGFITHLYVKFLNRAPDLTGLQYWINEYKKSHRSEPVQDMFRAFVDSPEFKAKNLSNNAYVELLYEALLFREKDGPGHESWTNHLNISQDRNSILHAFFKSEEFNPILIKLQNLPVDNSYITGPSDGGVIGGGHGGDSGYLIIYACTYLLDKINNSHSMLGFGSPIHIIVDEYAGLGCSVSALPAWALQYLD